MLLHMQQAKTSRHDLGRNIEGLRKLRNWSQAELGRRAGVAQKTISNIEAGATSVQVDIIEAIADAFGIEVYKLFVPNYVAPFLPPTGSSRAA